jgi:subtilase-type serine protease
MRQMSPTTVSRKSRLLLSLSSLALLAACGGGDGSGDSGIFTISGNLVQNGTFGSYYMASITQEWRDAAASFRTNSARFRIQGGNLRDSQGQDFIYKGQPVFSNPLQSSRVDYAHALGLTGAGQVIEIVDQGFRTTHEAFAGKQNISTGDFGLQDHGTTVASIAAGNSGTMVGVAPGANLIFSEWGVSDTDNLRLAAIAARNRNAVAQNNSWGYTTLFANATDYNTLFGPSTAYPGWLTALRNYAEAGTGWNGGVVVFAISNEFGATQSGIMDALPKFVPTLEAGWLAVGNSVPIFDDTGVSDAIRVSSACMDAARWCLVADGYWYGATSGSNTEYDSGYGSSYAAPQVAGALALLAQAFPNLTPHQLRARILASADNTFSGFVAANSVDLDEGTGVFLHDYSTEFGHGFLDIRAALLPIGQTTLAVGDGQTVAAKDYAFTTGGAIGDAVTRSLDGVDLTMNDALGGDFALAAKDFATKAETAPLVETLAARTMGKDFRATRTAPVNPLADTFAAQSGNTFDIDAPDGLSHASVLIGGAESYGLALSRTVAEGDLKLDLGLKLARDDGSLIGFSGAGNQGGATMAALTMSRHGHRRVLCAFGRDGDCRSGHHDGGAARGPGQL